MTYTITLALHQPFQTFSVHTVGGQVHAQRGPRLPTPHASLPGCSPGEQGRCPQIELTEHVNVIGPGEAHWQRSSESYFRPRDWGVWIQLEQVSSGLALLPALLPWLLGLQRLECQGELAANCRVSRTVSLLFSGVNGDADNPEIACHPAS